MFDDDEDDMDSDYDRRGPRRMDPRRYPARQYVPSRQFRPSPYDDSEDEYDDYEDWDDDEFDEESEYEEYYPRRQGYERQWARY